MSEPGRRGRRRSRVRDRCIHGVVDEGRRRRGEQRRAGGALREAGDHGRGAAGAGAEPCSASSKAARPHVHESPLLASHDSMHRRRLGSRRRLSAFSRSIPEDTHPVGGTHAPGRLQWSQTYLLLAEQRIGARRASALPSDPHVVRAGSAAIHRWSCGCASKRITSISRAASPARAPESEREVARKGLPRPRGRTRVRAIESQQAAEKSAGERVPEAEFLAHTAS